MWNIVSLAKRLADCCSWCWLPFSLNRDFIVGNVYNQHTQKHKHMHNSSCRSQITTSAQSRRRIEIVPYVLAYTTPHMFIPTSIHKETLKPFSKETPQTIPQGLRLKQWFPHFPTLGPYTHIFRAENNLAYAR